MIAPLVALIVLMAGAGTAAGADFGRMFFTPSQRAALDTFRKLNIQRAIVTEEDRDKDLVIAPPPSGPERMSVGGIVRRSDGKNSVWINNRAVEAGQPGGVNVVPGKNDNRVKLTAPQSGRSFELKVGQTVELQSGTIEEGYARREVVKPEPEPESADKPTATRATTPKPPAASPPRRAPDDLPEPAGTGRRPAQAEVGPAK